MAGYDDTRMKILETLMQRPNGTEIQPDNHQDFALSLLEYELQCKTLFFMVFPSILVVSLQVICESGINIKLNIAFPMRPSKATIIKGLT